MLRSTLTRIALAGCLALACATTTQSTAQAQGKGRVYELRTYTCYEGKLDDLLKRFREHTTKLFEKHGMTNIGYWVPADAPRSKNTLIYLLAHPSREAAAKNWEAFRNDPEWVKVRTESEAAGKIVEIVDSVFMEPTDFSKLK
jgi:hypothetical protein